MRIYAFEGLCYTSRAGDPDRLAAPPYDQINDAARDAFHARSPHQFVHLTRPVDPQGGDPYAYAARLHQRWLSEGTVKREERPSLYPYVIELAGGGRRLGVLALVELADAKTIRPHEQTIAKPLADRLALLEAMRVDLEPALLVCEDQGRLDELVAADVAASTPLVRHVDADGHAHVLYRVDDPDRIALYRQTLDVPAAIADGHHRYKVAQRFAAAHSPAPGSAAASKLAVVTSLDSPALTIDPIHRALKTPIDPANLGALAACSAPWKGTGGAAFAAAVAAAPQPALGVWVHGRTPEMLTLPSGPSLVVEILQDRIYLALGLSPDASTDGTVVYRSNPEELYAQVASGELGTGFFLPPMKPSEFAAAIADGSLLPPKSTRFLPKVMSGLVWADHEARLA
jgi:uncharacterized protein (DUF1015 family)